MVVVLDTNVMVSSFIISVGLPARIVAAWRARRFEVPVSSVLQAEYQRALNYDRTSRCHGMTAEQVAEAVEALREIAVLVEPLEVPVVIADDPDDDHVLACAVAAGAQFIVSGNRHLLDLHEYRGIRILTPAAFLAILDEAGSRSP